jgi:hypothetical protein
MKGAFSATFVFLATASIFRNIGFDPIIPEHLPYDTGIKATVSIEDRSLVVHCASLEVGKQLFDGCFNSKDIIVVASDNASSGENISMSVS